MAMARRRMKRRLKMAMAPRTGPLRAREQVSEPSSSILGRVL
jgi:hypothetical protein